MKTVLVTGGSGAIGSACARLFAQNGFRPIVQYCTNKDEAVCIGLPLRTQGELTRCG